MVALVSIFAAGAVLAQAPDEEPGRGGGRPGKRGDRGGQMAPEHREAIRAVMGVAALLGHENAVIANTENGVDVAITTEDDVAALQEDVKEKVDGLNKAVGDVPRRRGADRKGRRLPGLLMLGQASVSAGNSDDGVVLSITAEDAETVQTIQQTAPEWQEKARKMHQKHEHMRSRKQAHELLTGEDVTIATEETEDGIAVRITSDNPETTARIKELLPQFFEAIANRDRDRERQGRRGDGERPKKHRRPRDRGDKAQKGRQTDEG
jgi:hypothetical protein